MFRKIHSNSQSSTALGAGVRRSLQRLQAFWRKILHQYPFAVLSAMLVCILLSGTLAFTVMRVDKPKGIPPFPQPPSIDAGSDIGGMIQTYDALREVSEIQQIIQSIIEKDSLNAADSIMLISALKRFDELQYSKPSTQKSKP